MSKVQGKQQLVRVLSICLKDSVTLEKIWIDLIQYENGRISLGEHAHVSTRLESQHDKVDLSRSLGEANKQHLQICIRSLLQVMNRAV